MNMHLLDWAVVVAFLALFVIVAWRSNKYSKDVAGFLAANRCAGRYLLTLTEGVSGLGIITVIGLFQLNYKTGFASSWWTGLNLPVMLIMTLTGWIIYRFRQTRALTMAQFFEMRYGRRFRVFAGSICFLSGLLNFGIFPAVGADFFIHYCGLSETVPFFNITISTYYCIVVLLMVFSTFFVFMGGQITVLVTDFFQSFFCNVVFMSILIFMLIKFPMHSIFEGLQISEPGKSMINPFKAGQSDFNPWFFIIALVGIVFNRLSWQGSQAFNSSAKSPHEAKMAGVLATFRNLGFTFILVLIPLVAYMIMHHPDYSQQAGIVKERLAAIANDEVRDQMLVPTTMTLYVPTGLMGAFVAAMFAAFISTSGTYLHSWACIFIQDVMIPLTKKTPSPTQHIRILRLSIIGVAIFAIVFSFLFNQTVHIYYWFAITGAIWLGGAGAVIIGGLYTRWGNTRGAYAALITGTVLATAGVVSDQFWKEWYGKSFFLTGQEVYFCAMLAASLAYIVFSCLGSQYAFNLDKMLHREKDEDNCAISGNKRNWKELFGITDEFTRGDKIIFGISIGKSLFFFALWVVFTVLATAGWMTDFRWTVYFKYITYLNLTMAFIIAVWLSWGGIRDFLILRRDLKNVIQDATDDGSVSEKSEIVEKVAHEEII